MIKNWMRVFLCVLLCTCLLFPLCALADAGSFSGDSDYGGSSDWGSSWDDDSDYSSGSYVYSDSNGGGGFFSFLVVAGIIVFIIIVQNKKNRIVRQQAGAAHTDAALLQPMSTFLRLDPNFNEAAFKEKLSNLYVQMQNAWQAKDFEPMRPYFTDVLFSQFARQLDVLKQNRRTNYVERIAVLDVALRGWYKDAVNDKIVAAVRTRIVDYTVDDATGKILSGSNTKERFMEYEWTLVRSSGGQTKTADEKSSVHCPYCGAPMSINQTAKCPYCGSVVTVKDYDWAIAQIKGISQQSR